MEVEKIHTSFLDTINFSHNKLLAVRWDETKKTT